MAHPLRMLLLLSFFSASTSSSGLTNLLEETSEALRTWIAEHTSLNLQDWPRPVEKTVSEEADDLARGVQQRVDRLHRVLDEIADRVARLSHASMRDAANCFTCNGTRNVSECQDVFEKVRAFLDSKFSEISSPPNSMVKRLRLFANDNFEEERQKRICEVVTTPSRNPALHNLPRLKPVTLIVLWDRRIATANASNIRAAEKLAGRLIDFLMDALIESVDSLAFGVLDGQGEVFSPLTKGCSKKSQDVPFTSSVKDSVDRFLSNVRHSQSSSASSYSQALSFLHASLQSGFVNNRGRRKVHVAVVTGRDENFDLELRDGISKMSFSFDEPFAVNFFYLRHQSFKDRKESNLKVYNISFDLPLRSQIGDFLSEDQASFLYDMEQLWRVSSPHYDPSDGNMQVTLVSHGSNFSTAFDIDFRRLVHDFISHSEDIALFQSIRNQDKGSELVSLFHSWTYRPKGSLAEVTLSELNIPVLLQLERKLTSLQRGSITIDGYEVGWKSFSHSLASWIVVVSRSRNSSNDSRSEPRREVPSRNRTLLLNFLLSSESSSSPCRLLNSVSTIEAPTVHLSVQAYQRGQREESSSSSEDTHKLKAYLSDTTNLLAPPNGLRAFIKTEFRSLIVLFHQLLQSSNTKHKPYFVRMVLSSGSGIHVEWPGSFHRRNDWLPSREKWFIKAKELKGTTAVSTPWFDDSGAGYVVTLSKWVTASWVYRVDVSMGQFFLTNYCNSTLEPNMKWFLMDNEGFLVAHMVMFEPQYNGGIQLQHLNHKEPLVGMDLKHQEGLVSVNFCRDFRNESIRRRYAFNFTTKNQIFSNVALGKECYFYRLKLLEGTNVFLGVINSNCSSSSVFCPANVRSRQCILCDQDVETESESCECPCQCPWPSMKQECEEEEHKITPCSPLAYDDSYVGKEVFWRTSKLIQEANLNVLPACFNFSCSQRTNMRSCIHTTGCAWCELDPFLPDPHLQIEKPFCTTNHKCFRGRLRRGPGISSSLRKDQNAFTGYGSPFGIVLMATFLLFLLMTLSVVCYRHNSEVVTRIRANRGDNNEIDISTAVGESIRNDSEQGCQNLLTSFNPLDGIDVMSPYRINPEYERPPLRHRLGPTSTDSDNGYSTMTVQDSEVTPYTASVVAMKRLRKGSKSDKDHSTISEATGNANSEVNEKEKTQNANQIVVAATVHAW